MRVLEIEKLFQQEDTLDEVLTKCKEDFDKVDYYAGIMKDNLTDNPEEAKKALNELTGVYIGLKTVLAIAETEKKNRETRYYDQLRIDTENAGKKFVSASSEKEASAHVANYRRIRNLIQGYTDACEKAISTLQSILKYLAEEMKLSGKQE